MKIHVLQYADGSYSYANKPISENGKRSREYEITEAELAQIEAGEKDFKIFNKNLTLINSTRKSQLEQQKLQREQEREAAKAKRIQLLNKIASNSATTEEIAELANLI